MSERGRSIDPESLLLKVSVDQVSPRETQEALLEYQQFIINLRKKREELDEFNQKLSQLSIDGQEDSEESRLCREKAKICVEELNCLHRHQIELENREPLHSLYEQLLKKDAEESEEEVKRIREEMRLQKEREYEEYTQKWRAEKRKKQLREIDLEWQAIEKEIIEIRRKTSLTEAHLSRLTFAFFGEKRRQKQQLEQMLEDLQERQRLLIERGKQLRRREIELGIPDKK